MTKIKNFVVKYKITILYALCFIAIMIAVTYGTVKFTRATSVELETVYPTITTTTAATKPETTLTTTKSETTTAAETTTSKPTTTTTKSTTAPKPVHTTLKPAVDSSGQSLGLYRITFYCACQKCCGKWALNRPVDENGNEIVYGAAGKVLIPMYSCGADTSVLPYGTKIQMEGHTYEVMDTGGGVRGNHIDIYTGTNHEEAYRIAREFGQTYAEVTLL